SDLAPRQAIRAGAAQSVGSVTAPLPHSPHRSPQRCWHWSPCVATICGCVGDLGASRAGRTGHPEVLAPENPCCRHASYTATDAALARLSERDPDTIGIRTRAVTRGC